VATRLCVKHPCLLYPARLADKQRGLQYNAPQSYEAAVQAELEKYTQQTSRQKYASQKAYEQFREKIWVRALLSR